MKMYIILMVYALLCIQQDLSPIGYLIPLNCFVSTMPFRGLLVSYSMRVVECINRLGNFSGSCEFSQQKSSDATPAVVVPSFNFRIVPNHPVEVDATSSLLNELYHHSVDHRATLFECAMWVVLY